MKIMSVVGARPNFMKAAPIIAAIEEHNRKIIQGSSDKGSQIVPEAIQHILVHTGQHYGELMSDIFFADLDLPKPDIHLGVGSGSHAVQTAEVMTKFEEVLLQESPDVLIVFGDVNSTLACALVAAKMSLDSPAVKPLIAHVEAGLRSFDRSMPEEHNRKLTDHLCDILLVTEESGLRNLRGEGISSDKVYFVGNTMIDSLLAFEQKAEASTILDQLKLRRRTGTNGSVDSIARYVLLTLHRPANVDNREAFLNILEGLQELATTYSIVFPAHLRTQKQIRKFGLGHYFGSNHVNQESTEQNSSCSPNTIRLIDPLGYLDFLHLMKHALLVVTDSGGVQEETTCLGIPCVTVRENTERPATVEVGTNTIAGIRKEGIREAVRRQILETSKNGVPEKWDGQSGTRILEVLSREFKK